MTEFHIMPIPHTPLYIALASFVGDLLGSIADSKPEQIEDRAAQLENKAKELRALIEECRAALTLGFGFGGWAGSAADTGRGLIDTLLQELERRAAKAEQEAASLRAVAKLLKEVQEYYDKQSKLAEKILRRMMRDPHSRGLAQLMATVMGYQLAGIMTQFRAALTSIGTNQLAPLWTDADLYQNSR
jgi:F0F1-type ATP synthase membrane subunit b/b'